MEDICNKSEENLDSFRLLKSHNKLDASIHCAYYAAYLLSIYSLCKKFGYTLNNIEANTRGKDTHFYVRNELSNKIGVNSRLDSNDFNKYIKALKKLRKLADYTNIRITNNQADFAEKNVDNLFNLINTKYI